MAMFNSFLKLPEVKCNYCPIVYTHYIPMNIPMELLVCLPEGIFQLLGPAMDNT